jgi:hypothetical protein
VQAKLTHTHTRTHTRTHARIHTHAHTAIAHTHTHTHTHTQTHIHTQTHTRARSRFIIRTQTRTLPLPRARQHARARAPAAPAASASASQLASCVHVARQWRTKNIVIAGNGPAPSSRRKLPTAKPIKTNRHTRMAGMALGRPSPTALGPRDGIACAVGARRACAIARALSRWRGHTAAYVRWRVCSCAGECACVFVRPRVRGRNARVCAKACQ